MDVYIFTIARLYKHTIVTVTRLHPNVGLTQACRNQYQSLPMHILPFFMNPSLQVHTKEPKVFAQVEWSGQVPLISHSFTSVEN